jgi:hypothetical protein
MGKIEGDLEYEKLVDEIYDSGKNVFIQDSTLQHARYNTKKLLDMSEGSIKIFTGSIEELEALGVLEWIEEHQRKLRRNFLIKYCITHPLFTIKTLLHGVGR